MKISINFPQNFVKNLVRDQDALAASGLTAAEYVSQIIKKQLIAIYNDNMSSNYLSTEMTRIKNEKKSELKKETDKVTIEIA